MALLIKGEAREGIVEKKARTPGGQIHIGVRNLVLDCKRNMNKI